MQSEQEWIEKMREELSDFVEELDELITNKARIEAELASWEPSDHYDEDWFEEQLNECFGDVKVCGMTMNSARVLRKMDHTAFREMHLNWLSGMMMDNRFPEIDEFNADLEQVSSDIALLERDIDKLTESLNEAREEVEE